MEGTVTRLFADKGFGFIEGTDKEQYFFHKSEFSGFFDNLVNDVRAGHQVKVTFQKSKSDRGPRATEIKRTDDGFIRE